MIHHACSPCSFHAKSYAPKPVEPKVTVQEHSQSATFVDEGSFVSISSYSKTTTVRYSDTPSTYTKEIAAPVAEPAAPVDNNPYSAAILGAISAQLERDAADGASPEEIQSRLEAVLDGFIEGFNDAMAQLEGLAGFSDQLAEEIQQTYDQVLQGIDQLAQEYQVQSPVAGELEPQSEAPQDSVAVTPVSVKPSLDEVQTPKTLNSAQVMSEFSTELSVIEELTSRKQQVTEQPLYEKSGAVINARQAQYQVNEDRHFDFSLTTADGDLVTIEFSGGVSGSAQWSAGGESPTLEQSSELSAEQWFSVVGELDEDEIVAIKDLLAQVADISESFFAGDYADAFAMAQSISYNQDEIALFDTSMQMTQTEFGQVQTEAPNTVQEQESQVDAQFIAKVEDAGRSADAMGKQRSLVADLVDWVAQQTHPRDPWTQHLGNFVRALQA